MKADPELRPDPRQEAGGSSDASVNILAKSPVLCNKDEGIYKKEMRGISFHRGVDLEFRGE